MANQPLISTRDADKITTYFGKTYFEKLTIDLQEYASMWQIEHLEYIDYPSVNCIFKGTSHLYGDVVLKFGNTSREMMNEYNALTEFHGNKFIKIHDADLEKGVILQERITPGTPLRAEPSLAKRLSIFSSLYKNLQITPKDPSIYPSYQGWVNKITGYMSTQSEYPKLYEQMKRANKLCQTLCDAYPIQMLLHGDFHHDNILLTQEGTYKIIDPKGVIGNPIFDIPRFILNEFTDVIDEGLFDKINTVITFFEATLAVPNKVIRECLFIETTMANCWHVESKESPNMAHVNLAERLMDNI